MPLVCPLCCRSYAPITNSICSLPDPRYVSILLAGTKFLCMRAPLTADDVISEVYCISIYQPTLYHILQYNAHKYTMLYHNTVSVWYTLTSSQVSLFQLLKVLDENLDSILQQSNEICIEASRLFRCCNSGNFLFLNILYL